MTAALGVHAAGRLLPDLPPLRAAQFTFVGPASGTLTYRPRTIRVGRSATIVAIDATAEDQPVLRGTLVFGTARDSRVVHPSRSVLPTVDPDDAEAFMPETRRPDFFQHFDIRNAGGFRPFTPGGDPEYLTWVRHRDADGVAPVTPLVALADSLPPAAMVDFVERAAISTMTWSLDIVEQAAAGPWFLFHSVSEAAAQGYSQQAMRLFDRRGNCVAIGRQVVALFA